MVRRKLRFLADTRVGSIRLLIPHEAQHERRPRPILVRRSLQHGRRVAVRADDRALVLLERHQSPAALTSDIDHVPHGGHGTSTYPGAKRPASARVVGCQRVKETTETRRGIVPLWLSLGG